MDTPDSHPASPELYAIELRTPKWERLVQWYREAVGLRVAIRVVEDGYALLIAGGGRLALLARNEPGPPTPRISLTFEVSDLEAAIARLKSVGAAVSETRTDREGFREVTTADPDGNAVRLFAWPASA